MSMHSQDAAVQVVLIDDDPDNCDVVLGSSPLKGLLCRIYKAKAPERTVTERWNEAMAAE